MPTYWVNTVSLEHVEAAVAGGFTQAHHGKDTGLRQMRPGDEMVFYSPRTAMRSGSPLRRFTALGTVTGDAPYQETVRPDFRPWRLAVDFQETRHADPGPLLEDLSFITDVASWGTPFRRGLFEIPASDFELIRAAMTPDPRRLAGMPTYASADRVDRDQLLDFVRTRHRMTLVTTRRDGRPQLSPVSGGVDEEGRIVISTYPDRAKAVNLRRDPAASVLVHSDDWNDPYVQVDGTAEVLDMPSTEAEDALVEYFRCIAGEHDDWDEYRRAMRKQGKSLVRITVESWGPVARGGFPPDRAPS